MGKKTSQQGNPREQNGTCVAAHAKSQPLQKRALLRSEPRRRYPRHAATERTQTDILRRRPRNKLRACCDRAATTRSSLILDWTTLPGEDERSSYVNAGDAFVNEWLLRCSSAFHNKENLSRIQRRGQVGVRGRLAR